MREVADALAMYGSDVDLARKQHRAYAEALGCEIVMLEAEHDLADCCFVEDTVVVDGSRALITRMGFVERRPETLAVEKKLRELGYEIVGMEAPATLEGGDVLRLGDEVFVGLSARTNAAGADALDAFLGRPCTRVPIERCLHLKSAVTEVAINPAWVDPAPFAAYGLVESERPSGLRVGDRVLASDPNVSGAASVDISEFEQADGGLTCLSVLL